MNTDAAHEAARRLGAFLPWRPRRNWREGAAARLVEVQAKARTRTLDLSDLEHAVGLYRAALALCARHHWRPSEILVETHGGAVSNSYDYSGESTWIRVTSGAGLAVSRAPAPKAPHGNATWTTRASLSWADGDMPDERPTLHGQKARRDDPYTLRWRCS